MHLDLFKIRAYLLNFFVARYLDCWQLSKMK
jgi:hypothetical protein